MIIYLIVLSVNIFFLTLHNRRITFRKRRIGMDTKTVYLGVVCFLMFFLMAFRDYSVGVDTAAYRRAYIRLTNASSLGTAIKNSTFTGPGYVLICWLLHYLSDDPRLFTILSALAINIMAYKYANNEENDGLKYILLWQTSYLFAFSLNGNRQVLATLVQLTGISYLKKDMKSIRGWILVVFAISIHPVSSMIPVVFFAGKLLAKTFSYFRLTIFSIVCGILLHVFINTFVSLILRIFPTYAKYFNRGVTRGFFNSLGGGKIIFFYLFLLVVMVYFSLTRKDESVEDDDMKYKLFATTVFCVLGILNSRNTTIFRIIMLILPFGISVISNVNVNSKMKHGQYVEIAIHSVLILYMILNLVDNQSGVVPYVFATEIFR